MPNDFQVDIGGTSFSGTSVRVNISGVSLPGLRKVMWKKKPNKNNVYAAGRNVHSRSYGKKEYEASITVLMSDYLALENSVDSRDVTDIPPFEVIVSFIENNKVASYTLKNCEFNESGISVGSEDKDIPVELPMILSNVVRTR